MQINLELDSSVSSAPAGFIAAVNYVAGLFDATFTNNVTLNLEVGWGEVAGQGLSSDDLGESETNGTSGFSFTQIVNAAVSLAAQGDPVPLNALPASDPTGGGVIDPGSADAKALGLIGSNSAAIDGAIGLNGVPGTFTFSPANRAVSGEYDAIGTIEHELTEVMGRIAGLNPGPYTVQDLYRYSASGNIDLSGGRHDYFSSDHGVTNIANYNSDPSGDLGDWAASAGNDSFLAFSSPGVENALSSADMVVMAALGWIEIPTPKVVAQMMAPSGASAGGGEISLDFNTPVSVTGSPSLSLSNGGVATYASGSGTHDLIFNDAVTGALAVNPTELNLNGGTIENAAGMGFAGGLASASQQYSGLISGTSGATLHGSGNDAFFIGGANETIVGGSGVNTAILSGDLAQYVVTESGSSLTVLDGLPNRDGTTNLSGVEQLEFSDFTLVFDLHSSQDTLVYELYQAALNRTPDNAGFRYWAGVADANQTPALALADAFLSAPEFTQVYGANPTNTTYVTELYTHVLGRTPDQAGLTYWIGQANAGQPRDQLMVDFATSAENVQLIGPHTANGYWTTH